MNDVKWIKIVTDIFDDEKIRYIETMPNGDTTIVIWFRLLCLAGKSNRGGMLMMTDRIHYTEEMLASIFGRDVKTIQLALNVFENLGMIEIVNQQSIIISNWNKHQSADKLVAMREANRIRNIEYRERKRDITRDAPVTSHDVTDIDIELEEDKEKDIKTKKVDIFAEYAGDDVELKAVLKDFETMRKQKSPMTERAKRLLCNELDRLKEQGHDRIDCLNTAILNGWKSVYAPKQPLRRTENIPNYNSGQASALSAEETEALKKRLAGLGGKK